MKYTIFLIVLTVLFAAGCSKESNTDIIIPIPNGDFEIWDERPVLDKWITNSCPECLPAFETYIVRKLAEAQSGSSAASFIYNNVYQSYATNKFEITTDPDLLTGYIKSNITAGDTAMIRIDIIKGNNIVDSGSYFETTSHSGYTKFDIPVSQNSSQTDSAFIQIWGGKKAGTEITVDNLVLSRKE